VNVEKVAPARNGTLTAQTPVDAGGARGANDLHTVAVGKAKTIPHDDRRPHPYDRTMDGATAAPYAADADGKARPAAVACGGFPAMGEAEMVKRLLMAALSAVFLATVAAAPVSAQAPAPAKKETADERKAKKAKASEEKKAKKKEASAKQKAQRQKMKDCSTKWGAHKKATKEKGRAAHRKFMGECLKN
jgi:hypothetical protein